jgi:hypothetical protein
MALVLVLFFAFIIAIIVFVMLCSNTNLGQQNKTMLRQLQAYYLAQSGVQHALLKLRLLPKETYERLQAGDNGVFDDVTSDSHPNLRLDPGPGNRSYDLFNDDPPVSRSPYRGWYSLTSIRLSGTHKRMKLAQDAYAFGIQAEVLPYFPKSSQQQFREELDEEVMISRFTAGGSTP